MGRPRRIYTAADFKEGNFIKEIEEEVKTFPCGVTNPFRMGLFKCIYCGKEFKAPLAAAYRTQRACCSYECTYALIHKRNYGTEEHYLYFRWEAMKQRCNCPTSTRYDRYGARGIKIDPVFLSFPNYVDIVENLPSFPGKEKVISDKYQIDRIDNDKGYYPDNLRWVIPPDNTANRSKFVKNSLSKYMGVTFAKNKKTKPWIAAVFYKGKHIFRQAFNSEEEAALARDVFILEHDLKHKLNILTRNATTISKESTPKQEEAQDILNLDKDDDIVCSIQ